MAFATYRVDRVPLMEMSPSAWYDCGKKRRACDDMHVIGNGRYALWEGPLKGRNRMPQSPREEQIMEQRLAKKREEQIMEQRLAKKVCLGAPLGKKEEEFRNYVDGSRQFTVCNHYCLMRRFQTVDFVRKMQAKWTGGFGTRGQMTVREAFEALGSYVDSSDPDSSLPNFEHCLQTAEAIRAKGHPDWFVLVGLIHDMGKLQFKWGTPEDGQSGTATGPQWALGGDTWIVGCALPNSVVYPEFNQLNPDAYDSKYASKTGIYEQGCGIMNATFAWGHDEYMYQMLLHNKCPFPEAGLAMVRLHSCYPWHDKKEYRWIMQPGDEELEGWVTQFNAFDLYTKADERPDIDALWPYYQGLIDKYMPGKLEW